MRSGAEPGWPKEFPVNPDGSVEAGLVVTSRSGDIEGRTGGGRKPCKTLTCDGWFISVQWQTGHLATLGVTTRTREAYAAALPALTAAPGPDWPAWRRQEWRAGRGQPFRPMP